MDALKVSVIIPVHNSAKYLHQFLDSVLGQTIGDIEVICVDDGSTDDSPRILQEYMAKEGRLRVITLENTGAGAADARNAGISIAAGEYISLLDSDDFFDLEMLEQMVVKADSCSADIVLCDSNYYDDATGVTTVPGAILNMHLLPDKAVFSYKDFPSYIFQVSIGAAWNMLLRRGFVSKHELRFQAVHHADDLLFANMALVRAEKIAVVDKRFVYYRLNNANSQRETKSEWPDGAFEACLALKKNLVEFGVYEDVKQSFVNKSLSYHLWYLDTMKSWKSFRFLWVNMRDKYFRELDIAGHTEEYFYNSYAFEWYERIMQKEPEDWVYDSYYSLKSNTDSALFPFPENCVPIGGRIVLYGAGDVGKSYYSQLIYSRYCHVVLWVDRNWELIGAPVSDSSKINEISYDTVLIAVENKEVAKGIKDYLITLGVLEEKIAHHSF